MSKRFFFLFLIFCFFSRSIFSKENTGIKKIIIIEPETDGIFQEEKEWLAPAIKNKIEERFEPNKDFLIVKALPQAEYALFTSLIKTNEKYTLSANLTKLSDGKRLTSVTSEATEDYSQLYESKGSNAEKIAEFIFLIFEDPENLNKYSSKQNFISKDIPASIAKTEFLSKFKTFILNNINFSISPLYFYEFGTLNEFVFAIDSDNNKYKMSELNWTLNNHEIGGAAEIGWNWIGLNTSFSFGVPSLSGTMLDSDWLNKSDHSIKTNFSISENSFIKGNSFSIGLFANLPFTPELLENTFSANFYPYFGYDYHFYSFRGQNGYGWYGNSNSPAVSYDDPTAIYYEKGQLAGIDYNRENHNLFLGAGLAFSVWNRLYASLIYKISAYTLVNSIDTHYKRYNTFSSGTDYYDVMKDYLKTMNLSASLEFNFWNNFYLGADYKLNYQKLTEGVTYIKSHTEQSYSITNQSTSGSSGITHSFSVYLKYQIRKTAFFY